MRNDGGTLIQDFHLNTTRLSALGWFAHLKVNRKKKPRRTHLAHMQESLVVRLKREAKVGVHRVSPSDGIREPSEIKSSRGLGGIGQSLLFHVGLLV